MRLFSAPQGKVIFQPGQACPGFILLSRGSIRVTLTGPSGRTVVLYRVGSGDVCLQTFSCLISDTPYGAEGVAETELEGELVPARKFHARFAEDAAFRDTIMHAIANRFAEYQQLVEDVALTGFDARLAKVLLRLRDESGRVSATHTSLATETASGRAYVSRRLSDFGRRGLVRQQADGLVILNARELERIAADLR